MGAVNWVSPLSLSGLAPILPRIVFSTLAFCLSACYSPRFFALVIPLFLPPSLILLLLFFQDLPLLQDHTFSVSSVLAVQVATCMCHRVGPQSYEAYLSSFPFPQRLFHWRLSTICSMSAQEHNILIGTSFEVIASSILSPKLHLEAVREFVIVVNFLSS